MGPPHEGSILVPEVAMSMRWRMKKKMKKKRKQKKKKKERARFPTVPPSLIFMSGSLIIHKYRMEL